MQNLRWVRELGHPNNFPSPSTLSSALVMHLLACSVMEEQNPQHAREM